MRIAFLGILIIYSLLSPSTTYAGQSYAFKRALKAELSGNLEKAYEIMKKAYDKKPTDPQTKKEFENFQKALVNKYIREYKTASTDNLYEKKSLLLKAQEIDNDNKEVEEIITEVNRQIDYINTQAEKANESTDIIESIKIYSKINNFAPYFDTVKKLENKIISSKDIIETEISNIVINPADNDMIEFYIAAEQVFPDNQIFDEKIHEILTHQCRQAIFISEQYREIVDNERASMALMYLFLAWHYLNDYPGLKEKIHNDMHSFRKDNTRNLVLKFSDSFSSKQQELFILTLKNVNDSSMININNANNAETQKASHVIVSLELRNLSIDTKTRESLRNSKYFAGYQNIPNSAYAQLEVAYSQALVNLQNANQTYTYNPNWITAFARGLAQGRLNAVAAQLAATPQYIQDPVYLPYQYMQVDFDYGLDCKINYALEDQTTQETLVKKNFEKRDAETRTLIQGVHSEDYNKIKNKDVTEEDSKEVLTDFTQKCISEISKDIITAVENKNLYLAKLALQRQNYEKATEEIFKWKISKSIGGYEVSNNVPNWEINKIVSDMQFTPVNQIFEGVKSSESNIDLSIQNTFENSFLNDTSFPSEFSELKNIFKHVDMNKFQYIQEKKSLLKKLKSTKAYKIIGKINPIRILKAKLLKKSGKTTIEKCLDSIVVIQTPVGQGSGFIVSRNGYILTNYHVISGQDDIIVKTRNGKKYFADLLDSVQYKDLALLKINASVTRFLRLADVNKISTGETVYVLGAPSAGKDILEESVTKGVVSGVRLLDAPYNPSAKIKFIQTDAAMNPGNSGGPLINERGEAIGVSSQKMVKVEIEGINFAVSIDEAKDSFSKYIK